MNNKKIGLFALLMSLAFSVNADEVAVAFGVFNLAEKGLDIRATTAGELHRALLSLVQEREAVFVDTPGRNPSDEAYLTQLRKVCDTTVPMEVHLLMSATSDYEYMLESYKAYKRVPIDCVGFTKIDEAVRFGSLYNFLMAHHKPVSYVTTGQKVPNDIEFPTSDGFAQLILTKGCYRC